MQFPTAWKITRELIYIVKKAFRVIRAFTQDPVRQWLYDRSSAKLEVHFTGSDPLTDRVAVLVLFQPDGIAKSFGLTLDHLRNERWSTIVVSNSSISLTDKEFICARAARLIIRPNIGYDFGGYRTGVRFLESINHEMDRLILMNDSTWFPLREDDNSLIRMEMTNAAMSAHIFKRERKRRHDHFESHFLMFNKEALMHRNWRRFWSNFVMSNDRVTTIARGEKGISQAMLASGLHLKALIDPPQFLDAITKMSDSDLKTAILNISHHKEEVREFCESLLERKTWRDDFYLWVEGNLSGSRQHLISAAFIAIALQRFDLGFVKKMNEIRFHGARVKVLELEKSQSIPPLHPIVHAEMEDMVRKWKT